MTTIKAQATLKDWIIYMSYCNKNLKFCINEKRHKTHWVKTDLIQLEGIKLNDIKCDTLKQVECS